MQEFLVFPLFGPLASWGDIAVGEYRPSYPHPAKSAVLGLVAAALGIERRDDEAHWQLDGQLGFGLRVHSMGELLRDYHTIQVPTSTKGVHSTRRSELQDDKIETILSQRDYRSDAYAQVALWQKEKGDYSLEVVARALKEPVYMPYLGRKSCSPALPFDPQVVKAKTLKEAFGQYDQQSKMPGAVAKKLQNLGNPQNQQQPTRIHWEDGVASGVKNPQRVVRKDRVLSRTNWQFRDRIEYSGVEE